MRVVVKVTTKFHIAQRVSKRRVSSVNLAPVRAMKRELIPIRAKAKRSWKMRIRNNLKILRTKKRSKSFKSKNSKILMIVRIFVVFISKSL